MNWKNIPNPLKIRRDKRLAKANGEIKRQAILVKKYKDKNARLLELVGKYEMTENNIQLALIRQLDKHNELLMRIGG